MADEQYDCVIIGAGVTGLAAGIYAGRFQMKTAIIGEIKGGTIINTDEIANYPGFSSITGLDIATKIEEHAKGYGIEIIEKKVDRIEQCAEGCLRVFIGDMHIHTKTIIFATGTEWKKLNVPGEEHYSSKGVHYCALCDAPLYKDKVVAVVGGADSAAKEAVLLAKYAKKVYVLVKGDKLQAEPINNTRVMEDEKIIVVTNVSVKEILGKEMLTKVLLDKAIDGTRELAVSGLFVNVGHIPLSGLAKEAGVELNQKGEIMIDRESKTNVPGIYAAGDVADSNFKQAITGVAEGVHAVFTAYHFINTHENICYCAEDEHTNRNAR